MLLYVGKITKYLSAGNAENWNIEYFNTLNTEAHHLIHLLCYASYRPFLEQHTSNKLIALLIISNATS